MEKYLVTIEFRYKNVPLNEHFSDSSSKTITIGVFDKYEAACGAGNSIIKLLESKYTRYKRPNGELAETQRLGEIYFYDVRRNYCTNGGYLNTPFYFYLKIDTLIYKNIEDVLKEISEAKIKHAEYIAKLDLD